MPTRFRRLRWSLRLFGPWGVLRSITLSLLSRFGLYRSIDLTGLREAAFDRRFGVTTRREALGDSAFVENVVEPTDPQEFAVVIDCLPIDYRQYSFVDIGSGAGRLPLIAADPFSGLGRMTLMQALQNYDNEPLHAHIAAGLLNATLLPTEQFGYNADQFRAFLMKPNPDLLADLESLNGPRA